MTGISNMNIVLQQGGSAQEAHAPKQQSAEHSQTIVAQQQVVREVEAKAKVPESETAEKLRQKKEQTGKKNEEQRSREEKKKKKDEKEKESAPTGKLLDTVA